MCRNNTVFHSLKNWRKPTCPSCLSFVNTWSPSPIVKLGILVVFAFFFYFPLLYAESFYADDIVRISATHGSFFWQQLGRFFAEWTAYLYSGNATVVLDPFPLGLILSIFLLSIGSFLICRKIDSILPPLFEHRSMDRNNSPGKSFFH